jgi:hypothetical protein
VENKTKPCILSVYHRSTYVLTKFYVQLTCISEPSYQETSTLGIIPIIPCALKNLKKPCCASTAVRSFPAPALSMALNLERAWHEGWPHALLETLGVS